MKYLVLKQFGYERKFKTNHGQTTVPKNNPQSDTISRHFKTSHGRKTRRFRSAFTTEQIKYLEVEFKKFPYIGSCNRKEISSILNIPERAVKIWFQNRRMKEKKEVTNKESADEEQKKINMARLRQSSTKAFNHQSSTQNYTVCQSRRIYPDPSITKASIKHFTENNNLGASIESSKPRQDKEMITVKNFNNQNFNETNNSRIVNKASVLSRHVNNKACEPIKILQKKNLCITKLLTHELPVHQKLEHGEVKQENPKDLTTETQSSQVIHPKLCQNTNQDHRYVPYVQTLPQAPSFVPGNILWKPVNVMPVVSGMCTPPQVIPNNSISVIHPNLPKESCKCNCNGRTPQEVPLINIDGRLHLQSQYILTMPFNHFDTI